MSERHVLEVSEAERRRSRARMLTDRAHFSELHQLNARRAFWAVFLLIGSERPGSSEGRAQEAALRVSLRCARLFVLLEAGARPPRCAEPLGVGVRQVYADQRLLRRAFDDAGRAFERVGVPGAVESVLEPRRDRWAAIIRNPPCIPDLTSIGARRLAVDTIWARSRSSALPKGPLDADMS